MIFILILLVLLYFNIMLASGTITLIYRLYYRKIPKDNYNCYCDNCKHILKMWESNLPIINYIILKGKCRYCNKKIDLDYLIFELLLGYLFFIIFIKIIGVI